MLSISGGCYLGRKLSGFGASEAEMPGFRPTTARVREAMFSILGPAVKYARVLDLYAGCGLLGFEALSRGASTALAVESAPVAQKLLKKNASTLGLESSQWQLLPARVEALLTRSPESVVQSGEIQPFNLVFMDPPYALALTPEFLSALFCSPWVSRQATIVIEQDSKTPCFLPGAEVRAYGTSALWINHANPYYVD
ncbi:MAG: 16S rRNA (guanine(966)-N(2))-methyltransferase RsmD [Vampirovibrionales bacterium]|nr:16S rRNA (guanine(966)-N(2))-methyltransferase RsmD [Vampirovibrionales bacterium]